MLAAYSLAFFALGLLVSLFFAATGRAAPEVLSTVPGWLLLYVAGVAIWILARLLLDPLLDGLLERIVAAVDAATQYGRYRRIETTYGVAALVCLVVAELAGFPNLWVYVGGILVALTFGVMSRRKGIRTVPKPLLPEPQLLEPRTPDAPPEDFHTVNYTWSFWRTPVVDQPVTMTATGQIWHTELAAATQEERRAQVREWGEYVLRGVGSSLASVAEQIRSHSERAQLGQVEECAVALSFAQGALEYQDDLEGRGVPEYPKYPVETLEDGRGDCEDKAILAAALMHALGYHVALMVVPNHVVAGVAFPGMDLPGHYEQDVETGLRYYWCEATGEGCWIGERPQAEPAPVELLIPIS